MKSIGLVGGMSWESMAPYCLKELSGSLVNQEDARVPLFDTTALHAQAAVAAAPA
jgi:aspartate/glutamate racemase